MQFDRALTATTATTSTATEEGSFLAWVLVAAGVILVAAALITGLLAANAIGIGIAAGGVIQSTLFFGLAHVVARLK